MHAICECAPTPRFHFTRALVACAAAACNERMRSLLTPHAPIYVSYSISYSPTAAIPHRFHLTIFRGARALCRIQIYGMPAAYDWANLSFQNTCFPAPVLCTLHISHSYQLSITLRKVRDLYLNRL